MDKGVLAGCDAKLDEGLGQGVNVNASLHVRTVLPAFDIPAIPNPRSEYETEACDVSSCRWNVCTGRSEPRFPADVDTSQMLRLPSSCVLASFEPSGENATLRTPKCRKWKMICRVRTSNKRMTFRDVIARCDPFGDQATTVLSVTSLGTGSPTTRPVSASQFERCCHP